MDCIAGFLAAFSVSPVMYSIDKAVIEKTDTGKSLTKSLASTLKTIKQNPLKFLMSKQYHWILAVYGPTYMAANVIDSTCKINKINDLFPKLIGVTLVNMVMSILKDRAFAVYFQSGNKKSGKVGLASLLVWFVRDCLTIGSGFVIPAIVANSLQH